MSYTLGQAARAANRSKPTIARAIQRGRLSALRVEDGSYRIDPAELFRVYPGDGQSNGTTQQSVPVTSNGELPAVLRVERDRLLAEREGLLTSVIRRCAM
jgi:excisionase family DNA binding protein